MKRNPHRPPSVTVAQCAGAGVLTLLLLALNVLVFAPAAHAWLHKPACSVIPSACDTSDAPAAPAPVAPAPHDDACAVMLFSQGLHGAPAAVFALAPVPTPATAVVPARAGLLLLTTPHRLPASQAPPRAA